MSEVMEDKKELSEKVIEQHPVREIFSCEFCNLKEQFDYRGFKPPPYAKHLVYLENCYIMEDPFTPRNKGETLILGGDCDICKKSVCINCSVFYSKRFCKNCSFKHIQELPIQLHRKIRDLTKDNETNKD